MTSNDVRFNLIGFGAALVGFVPVQPEIGGAWLARGFAIYGIAFLAIPTALFLRACLKIAWGPAARGFGCGQGGETGASPQRAVRAEPTQATGKRPAARRVFEEKAGWLRCSSVGDRCGYPPSSRLAIRPFPRKQDSHGIFRQALNVLLLAVVVWAVAAHARGRQAWPKVPVLLRQSGRLAVEIVFGLLNPVLYLAILTAAFSLNRLGMEWGLVPLTTIAWILLAAVWTLRLCGAAFDPRSGIARAVVRALLFAALACVLVYAVKDLWLLIESEGNKAPLQTFLLNLLRVCPLYLIPAVLLWDFLRSTSTSSPQAGEAGTAVGQWHSFFLLPTGASRVAVAAVIGVALVTFVLTAHRRSEGNVRKLLSDHRATIRAAAERYDINPRLIASIVYVTHRDQLSPFRDAFERLIINAWGMNSQRRGPGNERWEEIGTDENPMLNRALDISVGLAQIKPRTAQTASVLATGERPDTLPGPDYYEYRNVEPVGDGWPPQVTSQIAMNSPIPVPAERRAVARMLLNAESNLETCALILALYQKQWEATNRDWSIRERPDILATLYQIGFARSKPHGAPRSNTFGNRVQQAYEQPWLGELLESLR